MDDKFEKMDREQLVARAEPLHTAESVLKSRDRLTLTLTAHHEHYAEQPTSVLIRHARFLDTIDEVYKRRVLVGTDWQPLKVGEIEIPGYVLLENRAGLGAVVQPSKNEIEEIQKYVIEVGVGDDLESEKSPFLIRPGGFFIGELAHGTKLFLRSPSGPLNIHQYIFPR